MRPNDEITAPLAEGRIQVSALRERAFHKYIDLANGTVNHRSEGAMQSSSKLLSLVEQLEHAAAQARRRAYRAGWQDCKNRTIRAALEVPDKPILNCSFAAALEFTYAAE